MSVFTVFVTINVSFVSHVLTSPFVSVSGLLVTK